MAANVIYKQIGNNIRQIRREKQMSQEKLAFEASLNRAYIGYIERGERHPSIETVYKIRAVLFDCVIPKNFQLNLQITHFA